MKRARRLLRERDGIHFETFKAVTSQRRYKVTKGTLDPLNFTAIVDDVPMDPATMGAVGNFIVFLTFVPSTGSTIRVIY